MNNNNTSLVLIRTDTEAHIWLQTRQGSVDVIAAAFLTAVHKQSANAGTVSKNKQTNSMQRFANDHILFLFTFYTMCQVFGNRVVGWLPLGGGLTPPAVCRHL